MYLTRKPSSTKLPITRKGTKYLARPFSHIQDSVSVVIAVRDMLKLAKNAAEVKKILLAKGVKINGRLAKDYRESICLFNILQVGENYYKLSLLATKKFFFESVKSTEPRLTKVTNKRLVGKGKVQLNLHDGSNILSTEDVKVNDTLYLDSAGKLKKKVSFKEGGEVFVISGKHMGKSGKISKMSIGKLDIDFKEGSSAGISPANAIAI